MDKLISMLAGLGVAGLVLVVVISTTGLVGGAAFVAALAALGPGGIAGGLISLGVIALVAKALSEYGFEALFTGVARELYLKGETRESIMKKIVMWPISKNIKLKVENELKKLEDRAEK